MSTAVSTAFGTGVTAVGTNINELLSANLATILTTAAILLTVGIVWRFTRKAVKSS